MRTTDETKGSEVWQPSWQLYSMIITELRGKRYTGEQCLYCLVQDPSMRRPTPVNSFCSFPHFFRSADFFRQPSRLCRHPSGVVRALRESVSLLEDSPYCGNVMALVFSMASAMPASHFSPES